MTPAEVNSKISLSPQIRGIVKNVLRGIFVMIEQQKANRTRIWGSHWGSLLLWLWQCGNLQPAESGILHSQFLHFFVVILTIKNVPLLTAFEDGSLLILDLVPRRLIDLLFLVQYLFQNLAHFQPDRVPVLDKVHSIHVGQRVRDHVRYLIYFVTADSHSTALYLRTSSFFTLRNIS